MVVAMNETNCLIFEAEIVPENSGIESLEDFGTISFTVLMAVITFCGLLAQGLILRFVFLKDGPLRTIDVLLIVEQVILQLLSISDAHNIIHLPKLTP